jgi:hypothetical protein
MSLSLECGTDSEVAMEKSQKVGFFVVGGLLLATFAARAAHSLDVERVLGIGIPPGALEMPNVEGPPPWLKAKDPGAELPPGEKGQLALKAELDRSACFPYSIF